MGLTDKMLTAALKAAAEKAGKLVDEQGEREFGKIAEGITARKGQVPKNATITTTTGSKTTVSHPVKQKLLKGPVVKTKVAPSRSKKNLSEQKLQDAYERKASLWNSLGGKDLPKPAPKAEEIVTEEQKIAAKAALKRSQGSRRAKLERQQFEKESAKRKEDIAAMQSEELTGARSLPEFKITPKQAKESSQYAQKEAEYTNWGTEKGGFNPLPSLQKQTTIEERLALGAERHPLSAEYTPISKEVLDEIVTMDKRSAEALKNIFKNERIKAGLIKAGKLKESAKWRRITRNQSPEEIKAIKNAKSRLLPRAFANAFPVANRIKYVKGLEKRIAELEEKLTPEQINAIRAEINYWNKRFKGNQARG